MTYRYDIEGLRAVAVLLVIIFHINEALIPGGFIGVDLFFVISGYVITQRIYKDRLRSFGDFAEFYRRRIRRITPVMLFVTAITLLVGTIVFLPEDIVDLSWSVIFASFSASNIYFTFFLDTSYFAKDSHYVPLLHLWSLGVEEQFYLIWPLLLFALMKYPRALLPTLLLLMAGSIAWGEYWLRTGSFSSAYYMLPSRFFQLCAGGACLIIAQSELFKKTSTRALLTIGMVGAIMVAGSAYALTGQDVFPGLNAIPVTLGASLLLLAGTKQTALSRFMSVQPARFIGSISYSMYLWHWPILAYLRYLYVDIDFATGLIIFITIVVISYLSTQFVEKPFRHSDKSFGTVFNRMFAIPTIALCTCAILAIGFKGYVPVFSPDNYAQKLAALSDDSKPAYKYSYVCQGHRISKADASRPSCIINSKEEPDTLLWGDSNAAHYIGILGALSKEEGKSFRNISHSSCPAMMRNGEKFAEQKRHDSCEYSLNNTIPNVSHYSNIIISNFYTSYTKNPNFMKELEYTVRTLIEAGKNVTLIGQAISFSNYDRFCAMKSIKVPLDCESKFTAEVDKSKAINISLKELVSDITGAKYVDFNELICNEKVCSPYRDARPIYFDKGHISMHGSWLLGREAVKTGKYKHIFH